MSNMMNIDEFLGHSTRGEKKTFLRKWKEDGSVLVWLHTMSSMVSIWSHQVPNVVAFEDRETRKKTKQVWGQDVNCWETEDLLKRQNFRDRSTGARELPPEVCPICKLTEWLRDQVETGGLDLATPVMRFEGDDPTKTTIIHAGGAYDAFRGDKLDEAQKNSLKKAGVFLKQAWRENMRARLKYLFVVVNDAKPKDGIQIAIESSLLGDKMKLAIRSRIKAHNAGAHPNPSLGNPILHPYPFQWEYDEAAVSFGDKYNVVAMDTVPLRPEIDKLIRHTDPPNLDSTLEKANPTLLRARLEQHALIDMPWDDFFSAVPSSTRERPTTQEVSQARPPQRPVPAQQRAPAPPPEDDNIVACDQCEKPMDARDSVCPHCHFSYEVSAAPPESPKPLPKRSEVGAAQARVTVPPPSKVSPKAEKAQAWDLPDDDEIPF